MEIQNQLFTTEQNQLLSARKKLYQLLHQLLSEPISFERFIEIKEQGYIDGLIELDNSVQILYDFFYCQDIDESIQKAREDFFRLFIGPDSLPAPPWESVYRSKERALFDFPTFEVRNLYNQFGLEVRKRENLHDEADDHIVFEIEFMIALIEKTQKEEEKDVIIELLEGQKMLLSEHLSKWVPQFSLDIRNNASSSLFIGIGYLLDFFTKFDCELVDDLNVSINNC